MSENFEKSKVGQQIIEQTTAIFAMLRYAGDAIMQYYTVPTIKIKYKSDNSPVTEADFVSNKIISEGLLRLFPDIPIVSEEIDLPPYHVRKKYEYYWIVDPLDGTKEFINKTDEFCINVALIYQHRPIAGYIYLPAQEKLYYAMTGVGSYEWLSSGARKLECNRFNLHDEAIRVVVSRSHMDPLTRQEIDRLRNPIKVTLGSALKFISIASGEADYYPRMIHIMEWDTAAGQILIEEAGGSLEDALTGRPLQYNKPSMINPYFIASGQLI